MDRQYSGVSMYVFNLLNALFKIDKDNEYVFFYNSFTPPLSSPLVMGETRECFWERSEIVASRIPNKIFNASTTFLNFPKIDKMMARHLAQGRENCENDKVDCLEKSPPFGCRSGQALWKRGEQKIDIFFSPNFLFTALSDSCKKIVTVHDLSFERCPRFYSLKGRLWHKFVKTRKMCEQADIIIAVSENTKCDIMELYGISEEKIRVVYSGVERNKTNKTNKTDMTYNFSNKYILFVGNVERRKNVLGIIKAFQRLNEEYNICDYDLIIAGQRGSGFYNISSEIRNLKLEFRKKVKLLGYVNELGKVKLYKEASLFVYPSFYEGFGFPPLEAMSYGCPVITSNCSSLPEIASDSAIMIDPYNVEDIASAMAKILTDEKLCSLMVEQGFERVKKFTWEKCAREMLDIFKELS